MTDPMEEMQGGEPEPLPVHATPLRQAVIYGIIMFLALFLVGWITGLGGSFGPNLAFSALMGLLAGACFWVIKRRAAKGT